MAGHVRNISLWVVVYLLQPAGLLAAADCNGNGVEDRADIRVAFSADCNLNDIPDECEGLPATFDSATRLRNGGVGHGMVVADLDADGFSDLAVGYQGGLSVRLTRPGPKLPEFEETVYPTRRTVRRPWQGGDVDGDGDVDLITVGADGLLFYLNDGAGGFADPVPGPVVDGVGQLVVADLTDDGVADVVFSLPRQKVVAVLIGTGNGGFMPQAEYGVGDNPVGLEVGEVDGAGGLDVVVLDLASDEVSTLLNNGNGIFLAAANLPVGADATKVLVLEDLTADGLADLVVGTGDTALVFHNREAGGFTSGQLLASHARRLLALEAGDVDGDGDVDLAARFAEPAMEIQFFMNPGNGDFNRGHPIDVGTNATSMVVEDLNGDAAGDLVMIGVTVKEVAILWNLQDEARLAMSPPEAYGTEGRPHTADLADVDGDGDLDVVTGNNNDNTISVLFNRGDGSYVPRLDPFPLQSFSLVLTDLDNDGDADIVSVNAINSLHTFFNDGKGRFAPASYYDVGHVAFHATAADLDGDGDRDAISTNRGSGSVTVLFNQGDGVFSERRDHAVGKDPRGAVAVDLDGDGSLDLAVASRGAAVVSVLLNDGSGGFPPAMEFAITDRPNFIVAGDFDSDGFMDVFTGSERGSTVTPLWNPGNASGALVPGVGIPAGNAPYSLSGSDLNADGHPDVVSVAEIPDADGRSVVTVLLGNGDRTFKSPLRLRAGVGPRYVLTGDLDQDGDTDIISANRLSRDISVFLSDVSDLASNTHSEHVCTELEYFHISSATSRRGSTRRVGKYVTPSRSGGDLLATMFQNVNVFRLHEEFLSAVFPERFGFIVEDPERYDDLVGRRATRDYYVGTLDLRQTRSGVQYTFGVVADTGFDLREVLREDEVGEVFARLSESFKLGPLAYAPQTLRAQEAAASWGETEFPVFFDDAPPEFEYEAYTLSVGYGRVRIVSLQEFAELNRAGRVTFQDILVIDQSPSDIEGVVGGVITGTVQGELSHVAIRTARRGTPNAFVGAARQKFSEFEGKLVRLEVFAGEYFVTEVEVEEAEEFWAGNFRELSERPEIDASYRGLDDVMALDLEAFGGRPEARYGGKATNFARLERVLVGEYGAYRESGFAIPVAYYEEFMRSNRVEVGGRSLTYEDWLLELLTSPQIESDSQLRFEALAGFRDFVRANGVVDAGLVSRLGEQIEAVFGDTRRMVRFRSSSNVEDALEFNGAGLYESTSACAADTLEPVERDGSHCDSGRNSERGIERALKKVWSSLWTFRAHEERTFYRMEPQEAVMGILVTRAFLDEAANGVAFTGNPRDVGDKRYVVTAQVGEASVVSPEPGTTVERNVLEVEAGKVVKIVRSRASSLVAPGALVMSDEKLRELGRLMWHVERNLALELGGYSREEVLLDFEFKVEADRSLAVKQVRPFLIPGARVETPTFELEIPPGASVCGVFSAERVGREPRQEYEAKSVVDFVPGRYELPTSAGAFETDLIGAVRFGAEQEFGEPVGRGRFRVTPIPGDGSRTNYRFTYEQEFRVASQGVLKLRLLQLDFSGRGGVALDGAKQFDESFLSFELVMEGSLSGVPLVGYSSCSYGELPRWEVDVGLVDGSSIHLVERFLPSENLADTGPASLVLAAVNLEGQRQTTTDYWELVYTARRHNLNARYWVVLEPPIELESLPRPVRVLEVVAPEPPIGAQVNPGRTRVRYLDEAFEVIGTPPVESFRKAASGVALEGEFVRGDVDANGVVNVTDAIVLLGYLFRGEAAPGCPKAADADDDGRVNVRDAFSILTYLFAGAGPLPEPFGVCSRDQTPDPLSCQSSPTCQ